MNQELTFSLSLTTIVLTILTSAVFMPKLIRISRRFLISSAGYLIVVLFLASGNLLTQTAVIPLIVCLLNLIFLSACIYFVSSEGYEFAVVVAAVVWSLLGSIALGSLLLSFALNWAWYDYPFYALLWLISLACLLSIVPMAIGLRTKRDQDRQAIERAAYNERAKLKRAEIEESAARGRLALQRLPRQDFRDRVDNLTQQILHETNLAFDVPVSLTRLATNQNIDEIRALSRHLQTIAHGRIEVRPESSPEETVTLTQAGYTSFMAPMLHPATQTGDVFMGDYINAGANAVVINRSLLSNSMNTVDKPTAAALDEIGEHLAEADDPDAIELFNNFNQELSIDAPKKPVLRVLFEGITKAVPTIESLAESVAKVSELFN